jgi:hypothetical protein
LQKDVLAWKKANPPVAARPDDGRTAAPVAAPSPGPMGK